LGSLAEHFRISVGFSDHTEGSLAAALSVGLGACFIEKHFTLDRSLSGPDHAMSCPPNEFIKYVAEIRLAETLAGSSRLGYDPSEEAYRSEFRRSIVARRPIPVGVIIEEEMLAYRRPGHGLKPYERNLVLGKKAAREISENERILIEHVVESS
jgi:sialic acid synthase SpsE